jgi:hypothetical protein
MVNPSQNAAPKKSRGDSRPAAKKCADDRTGRRHAEGNSKRPNHPLSMRDDPTAPNVPVIPRPCATFTKLEKLIFDSTRSMVPIKIVSSPVSTEAFLFSDSVFAHAFASATQRDAV